MVPSSYPHLSRHGALSHYKKFWLLQNQLEKLAEQSPCYSSVSLQGSNSPRCSQSATKDISKPFQITSPLATSTTGEHTQPLIFQKHGNLPREDTTTDETGSHGCFAERIRTSCTYNCSSEQVQEMAGSCHCITAPCFAHDISAVTDVSTRLSLALSSTQAQNAINTSNQIASSTLTAQGHHLQEQGGASFAIEYESSQSSSEVEIRRSPSESAHQASSTSSVLSPQRPHSASAEADNPNGCYDLRLASTSTAQPRTCTLCGTAKTPLWRSGPRGPKSLCNACGIRVQKTKRLEAVQLGYPAAPSEILCKSSLKRKSSNETVKMSASQKRKKQIRYVGKYETNVYRVQESSTAHEQRFSSDFYLACEEDSNPSPCQLPHNPSTALDGKGTCGNSFAKDVKDAAVLLMALSCGVVLS
ncbi:hypothetical protein KP509_18G043900 [Ceratopteris richardii]|uniref:GATA-type domain-containing protein n=1 Tax=Ceratopteris richardii TaxID=49495 RepID=A0A8T2SSX5_CERRI|nr:hypothetical protein KP509_18G043900 [Ceratopteris richardii]